MFIEVLTLGCDITIVGSSLLQAFFHDMKDPSHPMMMVGVIVLSSTLSLVEASTCTRVWGATLNIVGWGVDRFERDLLKDRS